MRTIATLAFLFSGLLFGCSDDGAATNDGAPSGGDGSPVHDSQSDERQDDADISGDSTVDVGPPKWCAPTKNTALFGQCPGSNTVQASFDGSCTQAFAGDDCSNTGGERVIFNAPSFLSVNYALKSKEEIVKTSGGFAQNYPNQVWPSGVTGLMRGTEYTIETKTYVLRFRVDKPANATELTVVGLREAGCSSCPK